MSDAKGFMLFTDQKEYIDILTVEQKAELLDALYEFANGAMPEFTDKITLMAFTFIRKSIERCWVKSETMRANAQSKNKQNEAKDSKLEQSLAKQSKNKQNEANDSISLSESVNECVKDSLTPISPSGDIAPLQGTPPTTKTKKCKFAPPTVEDVQAYCDERGNGINAQRFVDWYAVRGWRTKDGHKVQDWKACVRTWEDKEANSVLPPRASPHPMSEAERRQQHNNEVCQQVLYDLEHSKGGPWA